MRTIVKSKRRRIRLRERQLRTIRTGIRTINRVRNENESNKITKNEKARKNENENYEESENKNENALRVEARKKLIRKTQIKMLE